MPTKGPNDHEFAKIREFLRHSRGQKRRSLDFLPSQISCSVLDWHAMS
jgi:hypothetical protein